MTSAANSNTTPAADLDALRRKPGFRARHRRARVVSLAHSA
jgi:hypothetical protein